MDEPEITDGTTAGRFYNALRSSGLSSAALAHGEAYIGQESPPDAGRDCRLWPAGRDHQRDDGVGYRQWDRGTGGGRPSGATFHHRAAPGAMPAAPISTRRPPSLTGR